MTTFTGSAYRVDRWARTADRLVVGDGADPLRRDGETLRLLGTSPPRIGHALHLYLEPLDPAATLTIRTTSMIVAMRHETPTERLQAAQQRSGLKPQQLGERSGIALGRLLELQGGQPPTEAELDSLAAVLGVSVKWIVDGWE